jgi:hypothetical protein
MPVYHFNIVDGATLEDPVALLAKMTQMPRSKRISSPNKLPST